VAWIGESAQVASALFTAGAAGAARASVRQGQRIWRASLEPDIHPQVLLNQQTATTDLLVFNAGGGIAKGTAFTLAAAGHRTSGYFGDGFIRPGEKFLVSSAVPHDEDAECLVMYRSLDESSWAVDRTGPKRRIRQGRTGRPTSGQQLWERFYPDTDLDQLTPVAPIVQRRD
jgi:hypothetical protein